MANLKSSKKDIISNQKNRLRNLSYKTKMRTFVKKTIQAIEQKADNSAELVRETLQLIDKTAAKGVIKKQSAARKKSRLMLFLNKSKAA